MLKLVKADPRFRITTYEELTSELARENERVVTLNDIPEIARKLSKSFENIRTPVSLSISDIALACRDLLLGKNEHKCGDVYGFLTAPYAIREEITVSAEEIIEGAKQIEDDKMLPSYIMAGDKKIGPADWLFGALQVLQGKSEVVLTPRAQLPSLDIIPETRDAYFKGTWRHSDSFEDKYLSDRLRYQAWTLRFPNYK
jgi:hypothetical protein